MHVSAVCVGKLRSKHLRAVADDYAARLRRHLRFDEHEVKATQGDRPDDALRRTESERLLAAAPPGACLVALDERGLSLDSPAFARLLFGTLERSEPVCFFIGGALGHDPLLRRAARHTLAMAPWTLPHELARVVLIEQLYRALTLHRGEPYHK